MLSFSGNAKIFLYKLPVDLRKGFEGLSQIIESVLNQNPTNGAYYAFLNQRRDRMKVFYWDGDGFAIWYKHLQKGSFPRRKNEDLMLDRREFLMLLEGVTPQRFQRRFRIN